MNSHLMILQTSTNQPASSLHPSALLSSHPLAVLLGHLTLQPAMILQEEVEGVALDQGMIRGERRHIEIDKTGCIKAMNVMSTTSLLAEKINEYSRSEPRVFPSGVDSRLVFPIKLFASKVEDSYPRRLPCKRRKNSRSESQYDL